ncbi:diguanylate cyclase (GGDEF)-like protein/PAS domain S-box-containing protein [Bosea sp. OAE506]|uniref:putative bifunctional diguanylate cyclase/phosphodiesterase n=1 Tax=Bosea sp. OAE506 TaxID=2663870 RepID=UPI001789CEBA
MAELIVDLRPADEVERLMALVQYQQPATRSIRGLDAILRHAKRAFSVPIAIVSFVGADRQHFLARVGIDVCSTARQDSFCSHAILKHHVMVVPDATLDPRFRASPLVSGEHAIRFYAGAPLLTPDGHTIGALCIKDTVPRPQGLTADERDCLAEMAELVMDRLEAQRLATVEADGQRRFDAVAESAADAIITADGRNRIVSWNSAAGRMFGYTAAEAVGQSLSMIVPDRFRAMHKAGLERAADGLPTKLVGSLVTVPALRRDGTEFPIELSLSHWRENGEHCFGAICRDITERQETEAKLKYAAEHDALTGLANRTVLDERLKLASSQGRPVSLIMVDLDGFKDINDSLGHAAGDEVLKIVASRLCATAGTNVLPCRLGGDEFVLLIEDRADPQQAVELARRSIEAIEMQMELGERSVYVGACAGAATITGTDWVDDLPLQQADLALYKAKASGRGRVRLFTQDLIPAQHSRTSVSSGLRQAFERGEFELYYQPQVQLSDYAIVGAEALLRWNHPDLGVLAPGAFIETLGSSLIAVPVSEWILRTACRQAAEWRQSGHPAFRIGVNLFAAQFKAGDLVSVVDGILRETGLPPSGLELEVTENTILRDESRIDAVLYQLRETGVGIAFDDYGTGYASLTMLKEFPVTRLKIDRSFVSGGDTGGINRLIVEAISKLASGLKLDVIAEGIETVEQASLMRNYCREGQGYLFGKPMPAVAFELALKVSGRDASVAVRPERSAVDLHHQGRISAAR